LPGTEEEEAPTSTTRSHVNYAVVVDDVVPVVEAVMVDVALFVLVVGTSARGAKKLCHMYDRATIDDVLHLLRYRRGNLVDAVVGETTSFARTMKDPWSTQHFCPDRVH
jgi:hypothetical protein